MVKSPSLDNTVLKQKSRRKQLTGRRCSFRHGRCGPSPGPATRAACDGCSAVSTWRLECARGQRQDFSRGEIWIFLQLYVIYTATATTKKKIEQWFLDVEKYHELLIIFTSYFQVSHALLSFWVLLLKINSSAKPV